MIDSDHRRFQKPGVSRSGEVVEHSNSMQPDTGVGKLDNRENISSAIIVSLNNNDITLRSLCNVLRDVPSPGRWWKLLSDAAPRISNRAVLLSQEKRAMGINHDDKYYNARVLLLAESEKWYGWRFELQEISYKPMIQFGKA
jgi:hypothetical protein